MKVNVEPRPVMTTTEHCYSRGVEAGLRLAAEIALCKQEQQGLGQLFEKMADDERSRRKAREP